MVDTEAELPLPLPSQVAVQVIVVATTNGPLYALLVSDCGAAIDIPLVGQTDAVSICITGADIAAEELVLASAVAGEKKMEPMTGMVLVMVCVAASAVLPPERSVAVAVQVMISPSTPILA